MTQPVDVVKEFFAAYLAQDLTTATRLMADDFVFSSPQDDHIGKAAYLDVCFPTAGRVKSQDLVNVDDVGRGDVFVRYVYELHTGARHRNSEVITVRDGLVREVQVYFGAELTEGAPQQA